MYAFSPVVIYYSNRTLSGLESINGANGVGRRKENERVKEKKEKIILNSLKFPTRFRYDDAADARAIRLNEISYAKRISDDGKFVARHEINRLNLY